MIPQRASRVEDRLQHLKTPGILPVRYALCSVANPAVTPQPFLFARESANLTYTLRTIRPGSNVVRVRRQVPSPFLRRYVYQGGLFREPTHGVVTRGFIPVPVCDEQVWLAIADIPWNMDFSEKIINDEGFRNSHMHCLTHTDGVIVNYDAVRMRPWKRL